MTQKTPLKISSKLVFFGLGFFLPFLAHAVQNDLDTGEVGNAFLLVNPSVRAASLGGNQATLEGRFDAMFSNPAGLASLSIPEVWIAHNQSFIDTKHSHMGFGAPAGRNTFALSADYTDHGKEERTADNGSGQPVIGLGDFRFSTLLANAGWGRRLSKRIQFGAAAKAWSDRQDGTAQNGWAVDTGLIFKRILPAFDLAISAKNLGPSVDGYKLPAVTSVGAALHIPMNSARTTLFSNVDFPSYDDSIARFGLEFSKRAFSLRGGYETGSEKIDDSLGNFTFGGGANIRGWRVDYAWVPKGDLGDQHQLSLTVGFGLSMEERAQAAKELDIAMENMLRTRAQEYLAAGQKALSDGNLKLAATEFENATTWDPHNMDARLELERVQEELQLFEANSFYHQGVKYAGQEQWLDATFYLKKAVKLVPSHAKALKLLKVTEAAIQKETQRRPNITLADRQFNLGVKYYLEENYPMALKEWRGLLKRAPNQPGLREYIEKAEKMQAIRELEALKREKNAYANSIDDLSKKAHTFYSLNQVDKAIEMWERVVALDPTNKDAAEALKKAKERRHLSTETNTVAKSRDINDLNSRAMNSYVTGDLPGAAFLWKKALQIEPDNVRMRNNLKRVESELNGRGGAR